MIVPFFFAPALEDSAEGSRSGPQASARTADEERSARLLAGARTAIQAVGKKPTLLSPSERPDLAACAALGVAGDTPEKRGAERTFYDVLYDLIAPSIERIAKEWERGD